MDLSFIAFAGLCIYSLFVFFRHILHSLKNGYSFNEFLFGGEEESYLVVDDVSANKFKLPKFDSELALAFLLEHNVLSSTVDWSQLVDKIDRKQKADFCSFVLELQSAADEIQSDHQGMDDLFPRYTLLPMKTEETSEAYEEAILAVVRISNDALHMRNLKIQHWPIDVTDSGLEIESGIVSFGLGQHALLCKRFSWSYRTVGKWLHEDLFLRLGELARERDKRHNLVWICLDQVAHVFWIPVSANSTFNRIIGEDRAFVSIMASLEVHGPLATRAY